MAYTTVLLTARNVLVNVLKEQPNWQQWLYPNLGVQSFSASIKYWTKGLYTNFNKWFNYYFFFAFNNFLKISKYMFLLWISMIFPLKRKPPRESLWWNITPLWRSIKEQSQAYHDLYVTDSMLHTILQDRITMIMLKSKYLRIVAVTITITLFYNLIYCYSSASIFIYLTYWYGTVSFFF